MQDASIDQNRIKTGLVENKDGSKETIKLSANHITHRLKTNSTDSSIESDIDFGSRDNNRKPVFIAVSSEDGITPIPIYGDASGAILIQE